MEERSDQLEVEGRRAFWRLLLWLVGYFALLVAARMDDSLDWTPRTYAGVTTSFFGVRLLVQPNSARLRARRQERTWLARQPLGTYRALGLLFFVVGVVFVVTAIAPET